MANKLPVPVNAEVNRIYFNTSITEEEILALIQNNLQYFFKASSIWRDTQEYALYIATNANNTTDAVKITYLVNVNTNEYFIILTGLLYNEDGSTINGVSTGNEFAIWGNIEVLNHYFNSNYNSRYSWYGWNPSHNLNNVYLNYINTPAEGHVNGGMNVEAFNNNATSFVWVEEPKQSLSDFLTNIANAIRNKKGTTAQINAQDFASEIESIEGGAGGATLEKIAQPIAIPTDASVFIDNIYFNIYMQPDEVCNLIENNIHLFPTLFSDVFGIVLSDSNINVICMGTAEGVTMIASLYKGIIFFAYDKSGAGQDIDAAGFSGWNPEFVAENGVYPIDGVNQGLEAGAVSDASNEAMKTLVNINGEFTSLNKTLNGVYQGKNLLITENTTIDVIDMIDNKEIPTHIAVSTYDYNKWLLKDCPEEIVFNDVRDDRVFENTWLDTENDMSYMFHRLDNLKKLTMNFYLTRIYDTSDYVVSNCYNLEFLRFNHTEGDFLGGIFAFPKLFINCYSLKTLIINMTEFVWHPQATADDKAFHLNTLLENSCYFNGVSKQLQFGGNQNAYATINPNAEKTGVIYVSDNIYDVIINDETSSNYVSQIKRISEYVEE